MNKEGSRNEGYSGIQWSSQGPSCKDKEGEQDRVEKKMKRKRKMVKRDDGLEGSDAGGDQGG